MDKETLELELRRLAREIAVAGTLTVNLYELAKTLTEELDKDA